MAQTAFWAALCLTRCLFLALMLLALALEVAADGVLTVVCADADVEMVAIGSAKTAALIKMERSFFYDKSGSLQKVMRQRLAF